MRLSMASASIRSVAENCIRSAIWKAEAFGNVIEMRRSDNAPANSQSPELITCLKSFSEA